MYSKTAVVSTGWNAVAASTFVRTATEFKSQCWITIEEKQASATSLMGILALNLRPGDEIKISAEGADEEAAVEELCVLIGGEQVT